MFLTLNNNNDSLVVTVPRRIQIEAGEKCQTYQTNKSKDLGH